MGVARNGTRRPRRLEGRLTHSTLLPALPAGPLFTPAPSRALQLPQIAADGTVAAPHGRFPWSDLQTTVRV